MTADPERVREPSGNYSFNSILEVSEFFCDTIQGEGINIGAPAAFLRLQNCSLNCIYCDSNEVWRFGNPYTFEELFTLMEKSEFNLINKFKAGQHLVLTGGSPLKQQFRVYAFLEAFEHKYKFVPYVEIENECTLNPHSVLGNYISCWNNSPKLASSGNSKLARYKPKILSTLSHLENSWFKFVVDCEEDWEEILTDFLEPGLIKREQIILMPEGQSKEEVEKHRETVVKMAVKYNVRYTTREHVIIWDKKTGV